MPTVIRRIAIACLLGATSTVHAAPPSDPPAASADPATRRSPSPAPPAAEGDGEPGAMSTGDAYSRSGGSLMRAGRGMGASVDPNADGNAIDPRVAAMTLYAVAPPQPRVI